MSSKHLPVIAADTRTGSSSQGGFTLIEILTTVMIIGILMAIAIPQYSEYVRRSTVVEAITTLSDLRVKMEQYYLDNRNYGVGGCGVAMPTAPAVKYFSLGCNSAGQTYTITATGTAGAALGHAIFSTCKNRRTCDGCDESLIGTNI